MIIIAYFITIDFFFTIFLFIKTIVGLLISSSIIFLQIFFIFLNYNIF